jgi:hypothetical protein
MRTTRGKSNRSSVDPRHSTKPKALLDRWLEAYRAARKPWAGLRRSRRSGELPPAANANPPSPAPACADAPQGGLTDPSDERAEALAALCDRLLRELDSAEVKAAEIRFVVHKHNQAAHSQMDPVPGSDAAGGELVWKLRRLLASAGDTLADVGRALETQAVDLDESGRELLQDELIALDVDLGSLRAHLADPVDWDTELERLLTGEIGPSDDVSADEESDTDD